MRQDTSSVATVGHPHVERRHWYRPARLPVPGEPSRLHTNALINVARHARGCKTAGDDRIETRGYAVKRLLWRWGYRERSGRYAVSIAQLLRGLAPILGWDAPPAHGPEALEWVRRHRKSAQRWLDDLQAAGLITYEGERDNRGQQWRTIITLRPLPEIPAKELDTAARRLKGRKRREERRRRRRRPPRRRLETIRAKTGKPNGRTRAQLAISHGVAIHHHRRLAALAEQIAATTDWSLVGHFSDVEDSTHHFVASPLEKIVLASLDTDPSPDTPVKDETSKQTVQTFDSAATSAARTRAGAIGHPPNQDSQRFEGSIERARAVASASDWEAALLERVAARREASSWREQAARRKAIERAELLASWPVGRRLPLATTADAWDAFRHGVDVVAGRWGQRDAGPLTDKIAGQLREAAALYEAFASRRPTGFPASAGAALMVLAAQRRAEVLAGDVARLMILAKGMRAAALRDDHDRLRRAERRAAKRQRLRTQPPPGTMRLSRPDSLAAWAHPEIQRRQRRDEDLLALTRLREQLSDEQLRQMAAAGVTVARTLLEDGTVPKVAPLDDGLAARARRFENDLAAGRWTLPEGWPTPRPR